MKFVPIAEETGLIVPLGDWVIDRAAQLASRLADGPVMVNLSARQLSSPGLLERIARVLAARRVPASSIGFACCLRRHGRRRTATSGTSERGFMTVVADGEQGGAEPPGARAGGDALPKGACEWNLAGDSSKGLDDVPTRSRHRRARLPATPSRRVPGT